MPCYDSRNDAYELGKRIEELGRRLDDVTARCCRAFKMCEMTGAIYAMSDEDRDWWFNHKAADAAREQG